MGQGSLTVVGMGIKAGVHLTAEARAAIAAADEVLYLVTDPVGESFVVGLRPDARSLAGLYELGRERSETYGQMIELILSRVRAGKEVCAAFYGHPGVFVDPGHESVRRARSEGFRAEMQPAVSSEDCLFADLGLDPGKSGCQSYEASDFVARRPALETSAILVLWQIGTVGETAAIDAPARDGFALLAERLLEHYLPEREAIVYEASPYPGVEPSVARTPLGSLAALDVAPLATLVVPGLSA